VIVGALFALALYLGLRKLLIAAVLLMSPDPDAWWASSEGMLTGYCAQGLAIVFGAVAAAAGRALGFVFGMAVGALCGALFLGYELLAPSHPRDLPFYLQPLVLVFVGGIAGMLASRVWGAVPILDLPLPGSSILGSSRFALRDPGAGSRPTSWVRIFTGAMIMLAAVASADELRMGAQKFSGGLLRVTNLGQGQYLTWQIAVFGILAGGVMAGAATGSGLRHGLAAGSIGGVGVLGLTSMRGETLSPAIYWLSKLSLSTARAADPAALTATFGGILFLGILGGWLGASLFLPLAPAQMRQHPRTGLD
jgi:hypothetical protein